MDARLGDTHVRFRQEVRAFLDRELTGDIREGARRQAGIAADPSVGVAWQKKLNAHGWGAPAWPKEYGGTGWDAAQRQIFDEECIRAGAPSVWVSGLQLLGPVVMRFGTSEQKAFFLPRILDSEHYWAQGFSEPGSGSDLASLQMPAVRDGDDYVVSGTKIWTSHAHWANWIFLLVRTEKTANKRDGITFMVTPADAPGITVQPIISMSGEHETNQVFFDNVRIPVRYRIGAEGQGWDIAKYLLEFERSGAYAALSQSYLDIARRNARIPDPVTGERLWDDPCFRRDYADAQLRVTAQSWTEKRVISALSSGKNAGDALASILKVRGTEAQQASFEVSVTSLGAFGMADQREALRPGSNTPPIGPEGALQPTARHLNGRAASIYGGSNEIQRNILFRFIADGRIP
ncbi:acyl-CoA dehydrogenase family protein [Chachezhania sediminis]|uniref:acyl-CoA dehydrogenase family protein n=1 Tax=Chachezhania sediminis TaxID=2599291 RepID=UPI00131D5245|nr:acyl-CoA dehydrogenase family protein [Chachezhania sediminis]